MEQKHCVVCTFYTSRRCTVCNTYYCSIDCEHKNKEAHKIYCFSELYQRLKSILNFAHKTRPSQRWTLSRIFPFSDLGLHGKNPSCALIAYGTNDYRTYCAICGNPIRYFYRVCHTLKNDEYELCSDCDGKTICNISFMESEMCNILQKSIGKNHIKNIFNLSS